MDRLRGRLGRCSSAPRCLPIPVAGNTTSHICRDGGGTRRKRSSTGPARPTDVYRRGRGAVRGFGEAALDRALADPEWICRQLDALRIKGPKRARTWAKEAIDRLSPEMRWATCSTTSEARALEAKVVELLAPQGLWNRLGGVTSPSTAEDKRQRDEHVIVVRGYRIDLNVLYREMHRYSVVEPDGGRVFTGNAPGVPAMKRLLHTLFDVPVADTIHPVNNAVRNAARDALAELKWAIKASGRSARYSLHREL